jgi:hypothetical protein
MTTPIMDKTLTATELCEVTGLTYRRLDWWCRHGVFGDMEVLTGSGNQRSFEPRWVPIIEVLIRVSGKFASAGPGASLSTEHLKLIVAHVDDGCVDLGDGVSICW